MKESKAVISYHYKSIIRALMELLPELRLDKSKLMNQGINYIIIY